MERKEETAKEAVEVKDAVVVRINSRTPGGGRESSPSSAGFSLQPRFLESIY
jgi:hypothetical protein